MKKRRPKKAKRAKRSPRDVPVASEFEPIDAVRVQRVRHAIDAQLASIESPPMRRLLGMGIGFMLTKMPVFVADAKSVAMTTEQGEERLTMPEVQRVGECMLVNAALDSLNARFARQPKGDK